MAGRTLDGEPLAILDDQIHALEGSDDIAALLIVLGDTAQLVHVCLPRFPVRLWLDCRAYSTLASAAAGRSRAARQPPKDPAMRPPAIASRTAAAIAPAVTGALRCTVTVWAADSAFCTKRPAEPLLFPPPGNEPPGGPPNVFAPPGVAEPVVGPTEAVSGLAKLSIRAAPRKPRPTPMTPPIMPITTASPSTWPMTRRLFQPSALSVPNSRTRRETADIVSRLASRNAAMSTATASHLPRLEARLEALATDPVICLSRSEELVTVAFGSSREISFETVSMLAALLAATKMVLTCPAMPA